ncbi:MAG TPA: inositol monophosphatase family protein [Vicinamibacterales bacterium]|nr:inositol monophosphatase family protein [Vicinamibacterales bacterium]
MAESIPPVFLATAIQAVIKAGAMQLAGIDDLHVEKKGAIDLVTQVDREVEQMFRALIAERFPDHVVLAEEFELRGDRHTQAEYCWVFDPVDGTTNYAHGLPIFCCACSLERHGQPIVAAIYDPNRRELFTAERGRGAWLNGAPMRVSAAAGTLIDSLLCTGFHYDIHQEGEYVLGLFGDFIKKARAVRRLGSAAIDLAYVAAGRFDGFWEVRLNPWDISAGALLIEEAGGRVSGLAGEPFDSRRGEILASNGRIHDVMLDVIRSRKRTA